MNSVVSVCVYWASDRTKNTVRVNAFHFGGIIFESRTSEVCNPHITHQDYSIVSWNGDQNSHYAGNTFLAELILLTLCQLASLTIPPHSQAKAIAPGAVLLVLPI